MNEYFRSIILQSTGASSLYEKEMIQELWSGYGKIMRIGLEYASVKSVVVKHVQLPTYKNHPRGWNTDIGHQRKVKSYKVEAKWYETYSKNSAARLPQCLAFETQDDEVLMVLEDLDEAGYPLRKRTVSWEEIASCLAWLARFHASYLGKIPDGLWKVGTYWHLETRPQELAVLDDQRLREAAPVIDEKLNSCEYTRRLFMGMPNWPTSVLRKMDMLAGVDFQYVGGGCGMKDVAYFIGSCLNESECERLEAQILDTYFEYLQNEFEERNEALERRMAIYYIE